MLFLALLFALFPFSIADPTCPIGYNLRGGQICLSFEVYFSDKAGAHNICAKKNAHLPIIADKNINDAVQKDIGTRDSQWLDITCLTENADGCQWNLMIFKQQEKTPLTYRNFIGGAPNLTIGPCVRMFSSTGMWYSSPCTNVKNYAVCQFTEAKPEWGEPKDIKATWTEPLIADANMGVFRRRCLFGGFVKKYEDGERFCKENCGEVAFLPGEGRQKVGFLYFMALKDEIVKKGQWVTFPCTSKTPSYIVCEKDPENECDRTTPPIAPVKCTEPYFLNGTDTILPFYTYSTHF